MASASAMASSIASLVPEPIEKCAVALASPSSTMLSLTHRLLRIIGKLRHIERPGRAHPGEHVGANIHLGLEVRDIFLTEVAVDAVGQHHQIGIGKAGLVVNTRLEQQ